jgi:hypothetical protein
MVILKTVPSNKSFWKIQVSIDYLTSAKEIPNKNGPGAKPGERRAITGQSKSTDS